MQQHASKKGSQKVLEVLCRRFLESRKGSLKGSCCGLSQEEGF